MPKKNNTMDLTIFKAKKFWIVFAIIAMIFFLAIINLKKSYKSEVDVLLLPKNDAVSRNMDQVIGNARQIPKTLPKTGTQ